MDRRLFLEKMAKGTAAGGLWLSSPLGRLPFSLLREASAADSYTGPLWINVEATGGWDVALICDPKTALRTDFKIAGVTVSKVGNISYVAGGNTSGGAGDWHFQDAFFKKNYQSLLVINGIDTATNNHTVGERYCASGRVADGSPTFAAQVAAACAPNRPMSYIAFGGYIETAQIVSATHADNRSLLKTLANPNVDSSGSRPIINTTVRSLIKAAMGRRLARLEGAQNLVSQSNSMSKLSSGQAGQDDLAKLNLQAYDQTVPFGDLIETGLSAYQAGVASAMTLSIPGFDSHGSNDASQNTALRQLYSAVNYIIDTADARGIPVIVVISSDFGRAPNYVGDGTDHWSVTSMMTLCSKAVPAGYRIAGNRVLGSTTSNLAAVPVNLADPTQPDSVNGTVLTPGHVYKYLRVKAGIDTSQAIASFPISVTKDVNIV
jgi:hypothetical protein